jgi:hypothetical protein
LNITDTEPITTSAKKTRARVLKFTGLLFLACAFTLFTLYLSPWSYVDINATEQLTAAVKSEVAGTGQQKILANSRNFVVLIDVFGVEDVATQERVIGALRKTRRDENLRALVFVRFYVALNETVEEFDGGGQLRRFKYGPLLRWQMAN